MEYFPWLNKSWSKSPSPVRSPEWDFSDQDIFIREKYQVEHYFFPMAKTLSTFSILSELDKILVLRRKRFKDVINSMALSQSPRELLEQGPDCKGWRSAQYCIYPEVWNIRSWVDYSCFSSKKSLKFKWKAVACEDSYFKNPSKVYRGSSYLRISFMALGKLRQGNKRQNLNASNLKYVQIN